MPHGSIAPRSERTTPDDLDPTGFTHAAAADATSALDSPEAALAHLTIEEVEEVSGELHRRIGVALRLIGEERADLDGPGGRSPRWLAAELATLIEAAAQRFAAAADGRPVEAPAPRQPAMIAAVMYAAPTLPALLTRLDQDRRLLTSLARAVQERHTKADGEGGSHPAPLPAPLRTLLVDVAITAPARCALPLERIVSLGE